MPADLPVTAPTETPAVVRPVALPGAVTPLWVLEANGVRYEFVGDPILGEAEIRHVLDQAADPAEAVLKLSQLRRQQGFLLGSVALEQMQGNRLRIRLIEQRIVEVTAPKSLRGYFTGVENDPDLKHASVLREAALAEAYAARQGKRPRVSFETMGTVQEVRMVVREEPLADARRTGLSLTVGNHGNRYASRWTTAAGAKLRPGGGAELTLEAVKGLSEATEESSGSRLEQGRLGFSFVTPLGVLGASFSTLSYRASDQAAFLGTTVDGRPVFGYEQGTIHTLVLSAEQLIHAGERSRWSLSESWSRIDDNAHRVFYAGSEKLGRETLRKERYDALTLGLNFTLQDGTEGDRSALNGSVSFTQGLSDRTGTFERDGAQTPNPAFKLGQLGLAYERPFVLGTRAGLSVKGQWSDDSLPETQQFVLGGFGNLTAWLPGVAAADRGALARATLAVPDQNLGPFKLSVGLFYEAGYAEAVSPAADEKPEKFLSDVGVGVVLKNKNLNLSLGYAEPLVVDGVSEKVESDSRAQLLMNLSARW